MSASATSASDKRRVPSALFGCVADLADGGLGGRSDHGVHLVVAQPALGPSGVLLTSQRVLDVCWAELAGFIDMGGSAALHVPQAPVLRGEAVIV